MPGMKWIAYTLLMGSVNLGLHAQSLENINVSFDGERLNYLRL